MKYITRRLFIIIALSSLIRQGITATQLIEGETGNGLRVVMLSDSTRSYSTVVIALPFRLVAGYEPVWGAVARQWAQIRTSRTIIDLPTINRPLLRVRFSRDDDSSAWRDLVDGFRCAKWHRIRSSQDVHPLLELDWLLPLSRMSETPPAPTDFIVGVAAPYPVDLLWKWMQDGVRDWHPRAALERGFTPDTTAQFHYRHHTGELARIAIWQPLPSAAADVASIETASGRISELLIPTLKSAGVALLDFSTGVFPPSAPQLLWCAAVTPTRDAVSCASELIAAWSDLTAAPPLYRNVPKLPTPFDSESRLNALCRAKLSPPPQYPATDDEYRAVWREMVSPDRWSVFIEADTTRIKFPEIYRRAAERKGVE